MIPSGLEGLRAEVSNLRGDLQRATAPMMMPPMPAMPRMSSPKIVETSAKGEQTQRLTKDVETQLESVINQSPPAAAAAPPQPRGMPQVEELHKVVKGRIEKVVGRKGKEERKPASSAFTGRPSAAPTGPLIIPRIPPTPSREVVPYNPPGYTGYKRKNDEQASTSKRRLVRTTEVIERPVALMDPWNMRTLYTDRPRDLATYMSQARGGMGYDAMAATRIPKKRGGVSREEQEKHIREILSKPILLSNQDRELIARNLFGN